jgi:flavin reductase (DIM6/NTAB) family NADH-FMN oxidoreductase RutF
METLNNISYGMYCITTKYAGKNVGCIVNTVMQITAENPKIAVSINKENYTNKAIKETKRFIINILSEETKKELIGKFGFFSSKEIDKFGEVNYIEEEEE